MNGKDFTAIIVGIFTIATVAVIVGHDESGNVKGASLLVADVISTALGKTQTGSPTSGGGNWPTTPKGHTT